MDRRRWMLIGGGLVLVLVVAGGVVIKFGSSKGDVELVPLWLRSYQPPEGSMAQATEPVDPKAAWASCRPSPMVACSTGFGAGRRARKTYPANLADTPQSLISTSFRLGVGGDG